MQRLESTAARAPLNGIIERRLQAGLHGRAIGILENTAKKSARIIDLSYSLGFTAHDNGDIIDVHLNTPAFKAGLAPATRIIAVNGRQFTPGRAASGGAGFGEKHHADALLIKDGEYYRTLNVDYHDGEKYPHLVRDKSKPDLISEIIRPHATVAKPVQAAQNNRRDSARAVAQHAAANRRRGAAERIFRDHGPAVLRLLDLACAGAASFFADPDNAANFRAGAFERAAVRDALLAARAGDFRRIRGIAGLAKLLVYPIPREQAFHRGGPAAAY